MLPDAQVAKLLRSIARHSQFRIITAQQCAIRGGLKACGLSSPDHIRSGNTGDILPKTNVHEDLHT